MNALEDTWMDYNNKTKRQIKILMHCAFTYFFKMALKAIARVYEIEECSEEKKAHFHKMIQLAINYNKIVGNCYTGSLYLSLLSLLESSEDDLSGKTVGMYSYGSGCTAEFLVERY